jgi:hypothetical protein
MGNRARASVPQVCPRGGEPDPNDEAEPGLLRR